MSKSVHCIICHECVWFGAYGTSKNHKKIEDVWICSDCERRLRDVPLVKEGGEWVDYD